MFHRWKWKHLCLAVGLVLAGMAGGAYVYFYYATYQYCDKPYVDTTPVTDCDRLAADPEDPDRVAPPVWKNLDKEKAAIACGEALTAYPNSLRLRYESLFMLPGNQKEPILSKLATQCYRRAITYSALATYSSPNAKIANPVRKFLADRILHNVQNLNSSDAFLIEATFYIAGRNGYPMDRARASPLLIQSADLGSITAAYYVAKMYYYGHFGDYEVTKDFPRAASYAFKAADAGYPPAPFLALNILKEDTSITASEEQKRKWEIMKNGK